jgi:GNAT superfamily N-acetyltransferase
MSSANVQVRTIVSEQTHDLRRRVLRNGDPAAQVVWPRDDEQGTMHYGAVIDDRIVAIGTIYRASVSENARLEAREAGIDSAMHFQFRGMASDANVRGSGAGMAVLQGLIEHVREAGGGLLWCNARMAAVGFYEKVGMRVASSEFEIAGVGPHVVMTLVVSRT